MVMLFLSQGRDDAGFISLLIPAILLALVIPGLAAFLSKKLIRWRQPVVAWLVFCLVAAVISTILLNQLLS